VQKLCKCPSCLLPIGRATGDEVTLYFSGNGVTQDLRNRLGWCVVLTPVLYSAGVEFHAMYRQHRQQKLVGAILAVACLALAGWSGWRIARVAAVNPGKSLGTKTVNIYDQNRMHAVAITKVIVAGEQIQPGVSTGGVQEVRQGTPFQADDEWLKNTSITLQNRTDKMIVRAEIMLLFPDAGDGSASRPLIEYMITLGQRPEINSYNSRGEKFRQSLTRRHSYSRRGKRLSFHSQTTSIQSSP